MKRPFTLIKALVIATLAALHAAEATKQKPNFVVVMVDDMGYSDIGCFGGEVQTPNLDKLAAGGMRFTQFYNTAKCNTTRAELLTGNYAYSVGMSHMEYGATFGEVLHGVGYRTLCSGKWHQSPHPMERGFARYCGNLGPGHGRATPAAGPLFSTGGRCRA